jgi:hypothetical protein
MPTFALRGDLLVARHLNRTNKTAALSALGEGGETAQAKVVIWPWRLLTGRFEAVELSGGSDLRG